MLSLLNNLQLNNIIKLYRGCNLYSHSERNAISTFFGSSILFNFRT